MQRSDCVKPRSFRPLPLARQDDFETVPRRGTYFLTFFSSPSFNDVSQPLILPAEKDLKVSAFYHSEWVAKAGAAGRAKAINTLADLLAEKKLRFLVEVGKFDNHRTSLNAAFEAMRNRYAELPKFFDAPEILPLQNARAQHLHTALGTLDVMRPYSTMLMDMHDLLSLFLSFPFLPCPRPPSLPAASIPMQYTNTKPDDVSIPTLQAICALLPRDARPQGV